MAKSRFEYVKEYETNCTIMANCYIVIRISKTSCLSDGRAAHQTNDVSLMNYCATKVTKYFKEILLSYGDSNEHSFVFHKDTNIYNRRASKISSCVNSLFTAFYVNQQPTFCTTKSRCPVFYSSTFVIPSYETLKNYLLWRQSDIKSKCDSRRLGEGQLGDAGLTFARQKVKISNKQSTHIMPYHFCFGSNNFDKFWHQKLETTSKKNEVISLDEKTVSKLPDKYKQIVSGISRGSDLDYFYLWEDYHTILTKMNISEPIKQHPTLDACLSHPLEFEAEDVVPNDQWIVLRVDGKGFHEFSKKHDFEKPNDENALNVMNFAAIKVMLEIEDIILSYGQSDEYSFVLHKSTTLFGRRASRIESCVNSMFTANYIEHWSKWNPDRKLLTLPTFDVRTVPYPTDSILRDYLSWRQADVHINNLYNTVFWKLVLDRGMKNSDAEEYLRLNGKYSADKRHLLKSFDIDYDALPAVYRKGTILLRKNVRYENRIREVIMPYYADMIGDEFWKEHSDILTNGPFSTVELSKETAGSLCVEQLLSYEDGLEEDFDKVFINKRSSHGPGSVHKASEYSIRGLLCKCEDFPDVNSLVPNCWIAVRITGRDFNSFMIQHQFEKPNDDRGLNLMTSAAVKIIKEHHDIVFAYGYNDVYVLVFHNSTTLYKQSQSKLADDFSRAFTQFYKEHWTSWFPSQSLKTSPIFNATISSHASLQHLFACLKNEQRLAHEKNLYNTVLWSLIGKGGRDQFEAETELQNTTEADRNETLFQEFGINYNNMPPRHKKGTVLLLKRTQIDDKLVVVIEPVVEDLSEDFVKRHCGVSRNCDQAIMSTNEFEDYVLLQKPMEECRLADKSLH